MYYIFQPIKRNFNRKMEKRLAAKKSLDREPASIEVIISLFT